MKNAFLGLGDFASVLFLASCGSDARAYRRMPITEKHADNPVTTGENEMIIRSTMGKKRMIEAGENKAGVLKATYGKE